MKKAPYSHSFGILLYLVDVLFIFFISILSERLITNLHAKPNQINAFYLLIVLTWLLSGILIRFNYPVHHRNVKTIFVYLSLMVIMLFSAAFLFSHMLFDGVFNNKYLMVSGLLIYMALLIYRIVLLYIYSRYKRHISYQKKYIIIGYNERGIRLFNYFRKRPELGYRFSGFIHDEKLDSPLIVANIDQLKVFITKYRVDEIYYALNHCDITIAKLTELSDRNYIRLHLITNTFGIEDEKLDFNILPNSEIPLLSTQGVSLNCLYSRNMRKLHFSLKKTLKAFTLN